MKKAAFAITLLLVCAFGLNACATSDVRFVDLGNSSAQQNQNQKALEKKVAIAKANNANKDETYYLVGMHIILPYWQDHKNGLEVAAGELGVKSVFTGESGNDAVRQVNLFRQIADKKPAGILVAPIDPEMMVEPINQAIDQGVPVVCVDSDSPSSKRLTYFGTGNYTAGYKGAEILAEAMNYSGKVGILTSQGIYCLDERQRGFSDYMKQNYPGIRIACVENDYCDPSKAVNAAGQMLKDEPQLSGIFGVDAASGVGAGIALRQVNKLGKVKIVAFDKDSSVLEMVEQGAIEATMVQRTFTMSYYGLKFLYDYKHGNIKMASDMRGLNPLPPSVDTGIIAVGKDDVYRSK